MCMNYNETSQWAADLGSGYSSIRPLGEGGMGTLYRAHKDSLDVDVVIKRVKQKFKGRMDERAEANILKTLKHKYLPRIYDVIESPSGYVYTIMDMIPGENMQNYVKTHGPVSQKLAYRWACQLCEVIAYLHSQVPPILHQQYYDNAQRRYLRHRFQHITCFFKRRTGNWRNAGLCGTGTVYPSGSIARYDRDGSA